MTFLPDHISRVAVRVTQGITLLFSCLALLLLATLLFANYKLTRMKQQLAPLIAKELRQTLGRDVRIGAVTIRGWDAVVISNATVAKGASFSEGTALTSPQVTAHVNLLSLALSGGKNPVGSIRQVVLRQPVLEVNRSQQGQWDFQDIVDRVNRRHSAGNLQTQLVVADGAVQYHDARGMGTQPINKQLVNVNARLLPTVTGSYHFTVAADDAAPHQVGRVQLAGNYAPRVGVANVTVTANNVAVKEIAQYLPKNLPITFENGTAALRLSALFQHLPKPHTAKRLPTTALTAEVDLRGVGLRLQEMSAPVMADSGTLRLVHNPARYPHGSRLDLINVRAHAGTLPMAIQGTIDDLNLTDLQHLNPLFNVQLTTSTTDGADLISLFPRTKWVQDLRLNGPVALQASATGRHTNLQIDGTLHGERLQTAELDATGIAAHFVLHPGITSKEPSLRAEASVDQAKWGNAEFTALQVTGQSMTPWRQLDTALQFTGTTQAASARLPWGEAVAVKSAVTVTRESVQLRKLHASMSGGDVQGQLTLPIFTRSRPDAAVQATATYHGVALAQLSQAFKFAELAGTADGTLQLTSAPDGTLTLATDVTGHDVRYRTYQAQRITATLQSVSKHGATDVTIANANVDSEYGQFTVANGTYHQTNGSQGALQLPLHGEQLPLAKFAKEISGTGALQGTVTGAINAPELTATVSARDGAIAGRGYQQAHGNMHLQGSDLRFRNVTFTRPGITVAIAGGDAGVDPRKGLQDIPATATITGAPLHEVLDLIGITSPWTIDGQTQGTVAFRLTDHGVVASGDASIPNAVVHIPIAGGKTYPLSLDSLGLQFAYADNTVSVRRLDIQSGTSTVQATGSVASQPGESPVADLTFTGDNTLLEDLPQDLFGIPVALAGPANLQGTLQGMLNGAGPTPLTVTTRIDSAQFAAEGVPLGTGAADLTYQYRPADRELTIRQGRIENPAFTLTTSGVYDLSGRRLQHVGINLEKINLTALRTQLAGITDGKYAFLGAILREQPQRLQQITGSGNAQVTMNGRFTQPDLTMGLALSHLSYRNIPLPNLQAQLASEVINGRYALRINEAVAQGGAGAGEARLNGLVAPDGTLDLQVSAQDITPRLLTPWLTSLPSVDGHASLQGVIRGSYRAPQLEGDVRITNPVIAQTRLHLLQAHLRATPARIAISDGAVWLTPDSQPLTIDGTVSLRDHQPLAVTAVLPRQSLSLLRAFAPNLPNINGTIAGQLTIGGTVTAPRLTNGHVTIAGSAALRAATSAYPNLVNNIDLRVGFRSEGAGSRVTIEHLSALLDRQEHGQRSKDFQPGWVAAEGSAIITPGELTTPDRWQWDVYGKLINVPLEPSMFLVPRVTGFTHLVTEHGAPIIKGVMLASNVKIKEPKMAPGQTTSWGPFSFNPRLSIVLQIGDGVKMAKSIVRLPLLPTQLPWPQHAQVTPGVTPSLVIDRSDPAYDYNSAMLNPGTSAELPGTWGVVTGSLDTPQLYARFEVNKQKLSFPFNLIGSIRRARGHITYSLADGPRITMGIPDFPTAPQANSTEASAPTTPAASAQTPPTVAPESAQQ